MDSHELVEMVNARIGVLQLQLRLGCSCQFNVRLGMATACAYVCPSRKGPLCVELLTLDGCVGESLDNARRPFTRQRHLPIHRGRARGLPAARGARSGFPKQGNRAGKNSSGRCSRRRSPIALPTLFKPIELTIDLKACSARVSVPGVLESTAVPISNPVTKAPHRVRVTCDRL